jgi:hypothetical protein
MASMPTREWQSDATMPAQERLFSTLYQPRYNTLREARKHIELGTHACSILYNADS